MLPEHHHWQECEPPELRQGDAYLLIGKVWRYSNVLKADPTREDVVLAYHPNSGQMIHIGPATVALYDNKNIKLYKATHKGHPNIWGTSEEEDAENAN